MVEIARYRKDGAIPVKIDQQQNLHITGLMREVKRMKNTGQSRTCRQRQRCDEPQLLHRYSWTGCRARMLSRDESSAKQYLPQFYGQAKPPKPRLGVFSHSTGCMKKSKGQPVFCCQWYSEARCGPQLLFPCRVQNHRCQKVVCWLYTSREERHF